VDSAGEEISSLQLNPFRRVFVQSHYSKVLTNYLSAFTCSFYWCRGFCFWANSSSFMLQREMRFYALTKMPPGRLSHFLYYIMRKCLHFQTKLPAAIVSAIIDSAATHVVLHFGRKCF